MLLMYHTLKKIYVLHKFQSIIQITKNKLLIEWFQTEKDNIIFPSKKQQQQQQQKKKSLDY